MIFIKFKPSWPCSVKELSDFVSPTAHENMKFGSKQNRIHPKSCLFVFKLDLLLE